jgi:1,4-dihydroxy-2-naphthoate octaprenyltransferase
VAKVQSRQSLLANWRTVLATSNPPQGTLDPVSRWLVLTRAAVLPMTLTAALIAGLLGVNEPGFHWGLFLLASAGIVLAHVSNNLMNDLFDLGVGTDTADYPRALYAPHPVLSGMITRSRLAAAALAVNVIDLGILVALFAARGWVVVAFALGGFLISTAYTAPPLRLKKRGLGEPSVLVVWGPLMVGGVYYAALGHVGWKVIAASLPYALLATSVLMGKHIDKLPWDAPEGTKTLPVLLGAPASRRITQGLMAGFYALILILVALDALPWTSLVAFGALPVLRGVWRTFDRPPPPEPPPRYPIWPLWYAPHAFVHTRRAGALFVLGLAIAAVFRVS